MKKIQSQGVHHITLNGADRQTSIDFWEGVLGMPFVFDQPNLDNPRELSAALKQLEDRMYQHAQNLEFEQAAKLRDEIERLKAYRFTRA